MKTHQILLSSPDSARDVIAALRPKERMEHEEERKPWEVLDFEDEDTLEPYSVAVLSARGVMARDVEGWYGCCDLGELAEEAEAADADANVRAIIIVIDSPGGTVNGTPEAAERIARLDKPVMVWVEGEMCSAAYWLAASADYIAATPSSITGSIGCVLAYYDESKFLSDIGVEVQVFRSGELKAAGYPGTTLTETEAAHFQSRVDSVGADFLAWVLQYRPEMDLILADGRNVTGKEGFQLGIVDGLHTTREEAVAAFLALYA